MYMYFYINFVYVMSFNYFTASALSLLVTVCVMLNEYTCLSVDGWILWFCVLQTCSIHVWCRQRCLMFLKKTLTISSSAACC